LLQKIKQIYQVLSQKEKRIFCVAATIFVATSITLTTIFFLSITEEIPVSGGRWREGIIGQPTFINPVISTNDVDQEISRLVFASLNELGTIKSDDQGLEWTVRLNEKLYWQDKKEITSDDVIFTIQTILDPESRSPLSQGIEGITINRVSELEIKFILPAPYVFFETTIKNIRPIPRHIWENIPPANFRLSDFILKPVGSGPYKFASYQKDRHGFIREYRLRPNKNYIGSKPYIAEIIIKFFPDEDELISAYNRGFIDGFVLNDPNKLSNVKIRHNVNQLAASRYFAIFFNQAFQPALKNTEIRHVLNQSVPRQKIVQEALNGFGRPISSPFLLVNDQTIESQKQENEIIPILPNNELMTLELIVPNLPTPIKVAELLKQAWENIGINLKISARSSFEIYDLIKKRNYELLLFGNTLNEPEDLYSFWHSANRFYPGSNLSLYRNNNADALIEKIRGEFDADKRQLYLKELVSIIKSDSPAVFLYSKDYLYITSIRLRGFEKKQAILPADRFNDVTNWHVKTGRKLK